ncbi:MAG: Hsp20/alpha crystallin family protein [Bacteroidales bacterium]|nr:Hsp20/alpha crystallin family protein [Bacteroidales bacterium]
MLNQKRKEDGHMIPMLRNKRFLPSFEDDVFGKDFLKDFFDFENNPSVPDVNVKESKDQYTIEVAAPGMDKKDFNVDIQNNMLVISSEKESKDQEEEENYLRREFSYTSFQRSFSIPETVDADNIKAKYDNGVLYVELPKKKEAVEKASKQIKIE